MYYGKAGEGVGIRILLILNIIFFLYYFIKGLVEVCLNTARDYSDTKCDDSDSDHDNLVVIISFKILGYLTKYFITFTMFSLTFQLLFFE